MKVTLGKHYLVELYGCDQKLLSDLSTVKSLLLETADKAKAHIVEQEFAEYTDKAGAYCTSSGLVISESHITLHSNAQKGSVVFDLFTCQYLTKDKKIAYETTDERGAIAYLKERLGAAKASVSQLERGIADESSQAELTDKNLKDRLGEVPYKGLHYIIEANGCNPEKISSLKNIDEAFRIGCEIGGQEELKRAFKQFEPMDGYTGISGLSLGRQFHFTAHTWPEEKYAAIDLYVREPTGKEHEMLWHVLQQMGATRFTSNLRVRDSEDFYGTYYKR